MKKLLLVALIFSGYISLRAQTIPVTIQSHVSLNMVYPGVPVWVYFYDNGALVHSLQGITDSSTFAPVFTSTISSSLNFDSAVAFAIDCNGNKVKGVASPNPQNPWFVEDTIYIGCSITNMDCRASYNWQQSTSQALTIDFTDNSTKSPIPNRAENRYIFFGDGDSSLVSSTFSHTYPAAGTYFIEYRYDEMDSVSSSLQFCASRFYDTITVSSVTPVACNAYYTVDTVNSGSGTAIIYNRSTPLFSNPNYSLTYHWDFGDGDTSSQPFPMHSYATAGTYPVCLTLTADSAGNVCTSTFCDTLGIDSLGNLIYKTTGAGFTLQVLDPNVSLAENNIEGFHIYPNPVEDYLIIYMDANARSEVFYHLTDVKGSVLRSGSWGNSGANKVKIEVADLPAGLYILNVSEAHGAGRNVKVIKH
jgi:PKD repeat protein